MAKVEKYNDNYRDWVWSLATQGLTDSEIASTIGIPFSTFNQWKRKFPELQEAIKEGKEADENVMRAFCRCTKGGLYNNIRYRVK